MSKTIKDTLKHFEIYWQYFMKVCNFPFGFLSKHPVFSGHRMFFATAKYVCQLMLKLGNLCDNLKK